MKSTLLLIVFSTFVYPAAAGTCQYPNATTVPNLSAGFTTPIISGTKSEGFFIKCVYDVTYELNLWRIEKFSNGAFEIVFTYFKTAVPPEQPGGNYVSRNITLVSKNTIVFPDMTPDDIGDVEYKCTVQFVTPAITCIESTKVWVIAKPVIIWILPTRVKSDSLPVGQEIHVTVAGRDFLTKGSVENIIVTEEAVNNTLITTITDQSDGFKNFTSEEISISTPETSNTEFYIPVYMNTDNISIIVDEGNFKTETTPETTLSPTNTTEHPDSNVSTTAATNTTTTITSTVIPTTVTENSSQSSIDIQLSVLVPVVSLVVIILIIIVVYCVIVSFRNRRAKENERNSKDQFSMNSKL